VPRKERNSLKNEYPIQFIHLQFTIYEQKIPNTQEQFIHPNLHFLSFSINFHSTLTKAKNFYPRKKNCVFHSTAREQNLRVNSQFPLHKEQTINSHSSYFSARCLPERIFAKMKNK
jgi:hypothetical protein